MNTKHTGRIASIDAWLNHHRETIRLAQQMPLTHTGFPDSVGAIVDADAYLRVHPSTLHEIVVSGIIADAERNIADLDEELERLGFTATKAQAVETATLPFVVLQGGEGRSAVDAMLAITGRAQAYAERPKKAANSKRR